VCFRFNILFVASILHNFLQYANVALLRIFNIRSASYVHPSTALNRELCINPYRLLRPYNTYVIYEFPFTACTVGQGPGRRFTSKIFVQPMQLYDSLIRDRVLLMTHGSCPITWYSSRNYRPRNALCRVIELFVKSLKVTEGH